jgi:hypothetical protein
VHMSAVDLATPAIAHLDLAVAGGSAVADDKMISQTIFHPAHVAMVVIEYLGVALPRPTVMDDDELPSVVRHRGATNLFDHGAGEISIALAAA